ncbi:beta-galactosidase [Vibrio maritimus]|uniref:Beta-galactosidase n=1 Tax=Vibrio maritimus TaxID=990268 RepID=A0A090SNL1_9VIBR|nr:beta-galactosidase [Vibrio maritimus]
MGNSGSVVFQVELDGVLYYQSATLTGSDNAESVSVDIPVDATTITLKRMMPEMAMVMTTRAGGCETIAKLA